MIELNKVYNKDCLEFMKEMPNNYVDLIIADPPYNIGKDGGDGWDTIHNYLEVFEQWIINWKRILKDDGLLYCYCSQEYNADIEIIFRKHMTIQNRIIWHYNNGERVTTKKFPYSYEPIFLVSKYKNNKFKVVRDSNNIQKGIRTKKNPNGTVTITYPNPEGVKFTDVWNIPKLSGNRKQTKHPTEKPLELGRRMLKSIDANLVYIPFGGSGSEIINCIEYGVNWIATEINGNYINNIIIPRIQQHMENTV